MYSIAGLTLPSSTNITSYLSDLSATSALCQLLNSDTTPPSNRITLPVPCMPQTVTTEFTSIPVSFSYRSYYVAIQFLFPPYYFHSDVELWREASKVGRLVTRYSAVKRLIYD